MEWLPIDSAPRDGECVVNDPTGEYWWTTAEWGKNPWTGSGWFENGFWMKPQPTYWLNITAPPAE